MTKNGYGSVIEHARRAGSHVVSYSAEEVVRGSDTLGWGDGNFVGKRYVMVLKE